MIRHAAISLPGTAALALAAAPLHAEGPGGDMKAGQRERDALRQKMSSR